MCGSLSSLSMNTEHGETMTSPEAVSSPPVKPLFDESRFPATIDTEYENAFSVSCLGEDQVWTRGSNDTMKLLNVQGKLLSSVQTKSGNEPWDLAVTRDGDLVYTDPLSRTVNLVKNKEIQTVITLQEWRPFYACSTASGDLLVTMVFDGLDQNKIVRYSGSTETQTIQFDDQRRPLFSCPLYICENRNLDICVADNEASAVVVVNQSGTLRFRYTGHPSDSRESFIPFGVTTDSQSHIMTADHINGRIHVLDQDGQFLRYIQNIPTPWDICVDSRDNLFVANGGSKVYKIQNL